MTLDEAIDHCLERANQDCSSCADEHLQLAEWLIELKDLRKNAQVVDNNTQNLSVDSGCCKKMQQPLVEVRNMTVQELYEYAKQCGVSDYEIRVQYRDDGGDYTGKDNMIYCLVDDKNKTITL